jgi:hypothetical protein
MKILIFILALACAAFSQFRDDRESYDPRMKFIQPSDGTLFDMNKLSVSHSLSMGYYSSGSNSMMMNEYVAGLNYRLSDPLTLKVNLGMSYVPYSSLGIQDQNGADIYFKSATLDYKPSDTFRMRIDVRNVNQSDYFFGNRQYPAFAPFKEEE